jgi:hypothetical protein
LSHAVGTAAIRRKNLKNANHRDGAVAIAQLGVAQAAPETEPTESTILQIAEVAAHFEEVRTDLLETLRSATACSLTVFYGLLAWANLHAHKPSKAESASVTAQKGTGPHSCQLHELPQNNPGGATRGGRGTSNMQLKGELL